MKYRILGKTGLKVSVIGMGTWQFGGEWGKDFTSGGGQEEVTAMFAKARDVGINFIDTAECYGDHLSEKLIGQALRDIASRGFGGSAGQEGSAREEFILATKFGHHFAGPFQRTEPRTAADVEKQLHDSLRALQTNYIDLYQYHSWGDSDFLNDDVRAFLEKAKAAGKIRHIGNSVGANNKSLVQFDLAPRYHIETAQIVYNRLTTAPEDTLFPICERLRLGVLARVPLASGFLSGKYKPGTQFPASDVRSHWGKQTQEEKLAEVEKIANTEVPHGIPMARWALAWCLKSPAVQCVIPGCKNVEQVEENAKAADLPMIDPKHPWAAK
jgi:aryl-alcohol dehydrogenase-like predicted oxidoreductase